MTKKVEKIIEPTKKFEKCNVQPIKIMEGEIISAEGYSPELKLDGKFYFLIKIEGDEIIVGMCNYQNEMVHRVKGKKGQDIYKYIIDQRWITKLDHAAYLGKELERAELSIKHNFEYVQD